MTPENTQKDALTGLLTRKAADERLKELLASAEQQSAPFSIAFLDIDDFLHVNERYGHEGGDQLLVRLARLMQSKAGSQAEVGRYGGDEFVFLFPRTEREQAFLILERIRSAVENTADYPNPEAAPPAKVTVCAGVASFPIDARTESELLRMADQALYRAKSMGRNQVRLAFEERMVPKTSHYTQTQLERLARLAEREGVGEAVLLREALDNLLMKYTLTNLEE